MNVSASIEQVNKKMEEHMKEEMDMLTIGVMMNAGLNYDVASATVRATIYSLLMTGKIQMRKDIS